MKFATGIFVLLALPLMTALPATAGLELVAEVDFESDTLGAHPDASLAAGFFPGLLQGIGNYSVVDDLNVMTGQALRAVRPSGSGSFNFGLNLPAEAYLSQSVRMRWRFVPVSGPWMFVILRGPNLAIHGSLSLTPNSILFSTGWGSQNNILVGSYTIGESVDFDWVLDRETGIQSLSLNGVVVVDAMATTYKSPLVNATQLAFEGAQQGSMTVAIDNLQIFAGTGTTPNEASSWGDVKALYR